MDGGALDTSSPAAVATYITGVQHSCDSGSLDTEQRRKAARELLALLGAKTDATALRDEQSWSRNAILWL